VLSNKICIHTTTHLSSIIPDGALRCQFLLMESFLMQ
jgi:hypothetical protein